MLQYIVSQFHHIMCMHCWVMMVAVGFGSIPFVPMIKEQLSIWKAKISSKSCKTCSK